MTKRPDILRLSLGAQAESHKAALVALVADLAIVGRNATPSISELLSRIATAYRHDPERTAAAISDILNVAAAAEQRDPFIRNDTGQITAVRLADDDGRPYTLRDAAAVNPSEYVKFLKAGHGFRDEEE
mgnify:FL=1